MYYIPITWQQYHGIYLIMLSVFEGQTYHKPQHYDAHSGVVLEKILGAQEILGVPMPPRRIDHDATGINL